MTQQSFTLPRTFVSRFGVGRLLSAIGAILLGVAIVYIGFGSKFAQSEYTSIGGFSFHPLKALFTILLVVFGVPLLINAVVGQRLIVDKEKITIRRMGFLRRRIRWSEINRIAIYRQGVQRRYYDTDEDMGRYVYLAFEMPFNEEARVSARYLGWREEELREIGEWISGYIAATGRTIKFDDGLKGE